MPLSGRRAGLGTDHRRRRRNGVDSAKARHDHAQPARGALVDSRWTALIVLTAGRASMGFQFQSLASVSPLLVRGFGIGYADIGFLLGLYMLPGIALSLPG